MSDNHDLLNDKDVCSFEEHEAENVCSNKDAVARWVRDNDAVLWKREEKVRFDHKKLWF